MATVNGTPSTVSVFLRQPGGGFAEEAGSPFAVGSGPGGAAVGDYNGDGLLDLAVANYSSSSVSVLLRQPGGGFASGQTISIPGNPQAIVAGDFDGQGLTDLAVSLYNAGQAAVLLNTGTGFAPQPDIATGTQPSVNTAADFNGDGLTDIALINVGSNSVSVLIRVPAGGFAAEPQVPVGQRPGGIATADFNGDGRADLATTDYGSGTVSILLRNAQNSGFAEEAGSPIAVSAGPVGITAADLDRDGRPDLAVAANSGAVDVLRRNAAGGFTRDPAIPLAGAQNGIAAADFDGDGRPDLAVSEITNETFSALLNPAPPPPPAPTPVPPLPAPVAGKTVNVTPVSGKVLIKLPRGTRYTPLTAAAQIPVGASIDTRAGRITITAAQGKGRTASADFYDGLFTLTQTKGSKPLATLTLTEKLSCPRRGRGSAAAAKKRSRKLWGDGSGAFRTRGQYSSATVRGTRWLTQDSCGATLTLVAKGAVSVRDLVRRRTAIVRAGKRYTARRRR
ncbi:FG-GAP repeat domain-containing protein [Candidatus Solirubrobacter pratensis]|uniref:FG-GAP repeat domain-containing protein n=1 Tax=Candidatus Solirubrobacter pratensis TaxID=1298857 RepID=UPI00041DF427|nr:VCBS repeat-containing protein [Candidatus Solirubrobacter pratensis]